MIVQGENLVPLRSAASASDLRLSPLLANRQDGIEFPVCLPSEAIDFGQTGSADNCASYEEATRRLSHSHAPMTFNLIFS